VCEYVLCLGGIRSTPGAGSDPARTIILRELFYIQRPLAGAERKAYNNPKGANNTDESKVKRLTK
jgi:hypothetical protein